MELLSACALLKARARCAEVFAPMGKIRARTGEPRDGTRLTTLSAKGGRGQQGVDYPLPYIRGHGNLTRLHNPQYVEVDVEEARRDGATLPWTPS